MSSRVEVRGELSLDGSGWEKTVRTAEKQAEHLGEGLKDHLTEAFTAGAIEETIRRTIEMGAHIVDLSRRLGVSTAAVQVWDQALRKNGSSVEAAAGFFEKLGIARAKALGGGQEGEKFLESFAQFGISLDNLRTDRVEDLAEKISEVFAAGGDPQQLIESLRQVGGKAAGEMIPALIAGIKEMREEAVQAGTILEDEVVHKLKEADDRAKQLGNAMMSWIAPWVADLVEGFQVVTDSWTQLIKMTVAFSTWLAIHPLDLTGAFKVAGQVGDAVHAEQEAREKAAKREASRQDATKPAVDFGEDAAALSAAKELEDAQEKLKEEKEARAFKLLHALEQEIELRKKITAELHHAESIERNNEGKQTLSSVDIRRRATKHQEELDEMQKKHEPKIATDSLNRVGNFLGQTMGSNVNSVQERIVQSQTRLITAHQTTDRALAKLTETLRSLPPMTAPNKREGRLDNGFGEGQSINLDPIFPP